MRTIVFFLFIAISLGSAAQGRFQKNIALHFGAAGTNQNSKGRFSWGVGAELGPNITKGFALLAKPTLMSRGYKGAYKVSVLYLDVPVDLEFNWKADFLGDDINWYLALGAYGGVALAGTYKSGERKKLKFGEGLTDNRSPIDYGLHGAFGYIGQRGGKLGAQLQLGLRNVVPEALQATAQSMKLNNFTFYFTIPITNVKK